MALPSTVLTPNQNNAFLDASVAGNTIAVAKAGQYYTVVAVAGFGSSGSVLTIESSNDGGSTWGAGQGRPAETGTLVSTIASDGLYDIISGRATHIRLRTTTAGAAILSLQALGGRDLQDVRIVEGGGGGGGGGAAIASDGGALAHVTNFPAGAAQDGTDTTGVAAPAGAVGIRGWLSGSYDRLGALSTILTRLAGTLKTDGSAVIQPISAASLPLPQGAAQDGTDATGVAQAAGGAGIRGWLSTLVSVLRGTLSVVETPFTPIPGATKALTVGPTATTAPLVLPTVTAASYRVRVASSSTSAVAWRLNTSTPGTAALVPIAYGTNGTGGTVGDKAIEPGGVEIFALTAAQQTAIAAGSLYLSAITPAGGSATIYITPGTAGA